MSNERRMRACRSAGGMCCSASSRYVVMRRELGPCSSPLRDPATGEIAAAVATFFDVTDRRRAEVFVEGHGRVLELVARGAPTVVGLLGPIADDRPEELFLGAEVVLHHRVVPLVGRLGDLAERHRIQAVIGVETLGDDDESFCGDC
jgi:hypothetical protein